jgi:hypothetical protein
MLIATELARIELRKDVMNVQNDGHTCEPQRKCRENKKIRYRMYVDQVVPPP